MYRAIAIMGAGLALAGCSSTSDWLKTGPTMETVRFESEPPGAEAKMSNGQTCRTPCALAVPSGGPYTVTFTLNGYQPETSEVKLTSMGDNTSQLRPNPVLVDLTPMPPPVKKKPVRKKKKPAPKPTARAKPAPAATQPPPMAAQPPQQQAPSPWPATPTR
jgi:PEGA domain